MLEVKDIRFSRGGNKILDGISLTFNPGAVTALIGPNGAGKTTLLKILSGEFLADTGQVIIGDRPIEQWTAKELATFRAMLPQESQLNFPFQVFEVALMGRLPFLGKQTHSEDCRIAQETLTRLHMDKMSERLYPTLSGGEKQRVQTARVLAQIWEPDSERPPLLLLDEPIANLDLRHQFCVLEIARDMALRGATVIVTLHDFNLAARYADQVVVLNAGKTAISGPPLKVFRSATITEVFGIQITLMDDPDNDNPHIGVQPSL